ncbi:MAG: hypothetical protein E7146_00685 [Rikenellaceae bacterium]|nr:hypothetical protein [Rikenellaceae bacterium]
MKNELRFLAIDGFRPVKNDIDYEIPDFDKVDLSAIEERPGAYIIVSQGQHFPYPDGESKIMYIGKSDNLKKRLSRHYKNYTDVCEFNHPPQHYPSRYNYMRAFGAKVYCFYTAGAQASKNLESFLIEAFAKRYGAIPVGNGARSFRC